MFPFLLIQECFQEKLTFTFLFFQSFFFCLLFFAFLCWLLFRLLPSKYNYASSLGSFCLWLLKTYLSIYHYLHIYQSIVCFLPWKSHLPLNHFSSSTDILVSKSNSRLAFCVSFTSFVSYS